MRQQGLSNNQIVSTLQREGYESHNIFDAMNHADLKGGVNAMQMDNPEEVPYPENSMDMTGQNYVDNSSQIQPPDDMMPDPGNVQMSGGPINQEQQYPYQNQNPYQDGIGMPPGQEMPGPQQQGMPPPMDGPLDNMPPPMGPMPEMNNSRGMDERIEEIAESIIDEKWDELLKSVNKIVDWKNKTETKLVKMEQEFSDLQKNFDDLHRAVVGKIGEYDKNILSVGTEIKAMEKVFQKVLPTFTENVSELSRITSSLKKK